MAPIGIFDSGYGGLTIFRAIADALPRYDYLYLGDSARAPYGNKSFEAIYEATWQCVRALLDAGCPLVILACNTASARALRRIQQTVLLKHYPDRRVLGVIRPTAEVLGDYSTTGHVGILATAGTIISQSYPIEVAKFAPHIQLYQQACPMLVPLIENGEHESAGARLFIEAYAAALSAQCEKIDTVMLACTHYPIVAETIAQALPDGIRVVSQGPIVAKSLTEYLARHPDMERRISTGSTRRFLTTDDPEDFNTHASLFFGEPVSAEHFDAGLH